MSAQEWQKLADLAKVATEAFEALKTAVLLQQLDLKSGPEQDTLIELSQQLANETSLQSSLSYFLTPQSQWTGGDSYVIKQPHITGTFTQKIPESRPTRQQIVSALDELLDGIQWADDIVRQTGLSLERAQEILDLHQQLKSE